MDWPMCRQVERQACRTKEMIERLDVDVLELVRLRGGDAYAQARLNCLNCANARECLLWLDAVPPSKEEPTFCPNLELFEGLRKQPAPPIAAE